MEAFREVFDELPLTWAQRVDTLRGDYTHGGSWIARQACALMATCAAEPPYVALGVAEATPRDMVNALALLTWALVWMRPSMAVIANTVTHIWVQAVPADALLMVEQPDAIIMALRKSAERHAASWGDASRMIAEHAVPQLREPVFTLSRSATIEQVLTNAAQSRASRSPLRVIIAESAPGREGVALAEALRAAGADVSVVADSAIGVAMADAGMVALGADSLRHDGTLINKAGSYITALAAHDRGIPVYALCERLKITPESYPLFLERTASADETSIVSWLFDATPARLITAYITEDGLLQQDEIAREASELEEALSHFRSFVNQALQARRTHPSASESHE